MFSKIRKGMWTNGTLKTIMDVVEKGTHSLRRVSRLWNIPMSSLINHLNGKTKSRKMGLRGVFKKKRCYSDQVDLRHARMWTIHKPTIIEDEGCKANKNKGYTIPKWNTRH